MVKKIAPFATPKDDAPILRREAALQAFVEGHPDERRKKQAPPTDRIVAYLPFEMARTLRQAALEGDRSVSAAITEAVREWLQRRK
jgi:hypothetical protein